MDDPVFIAAVAVAGMALVLVLSLAVAVVLVRVQGMEARAEIKWLHSSLMDAWAGWQAVATDREIDAQAHKRRIARREAYIARLVACIGDLGRGLRVDLPPMPVDSVLGELGPGERA